MLDGGSIKPGFSFLRACKRPWMCCWSARISGFRRLYCTHVVENITERARDGFPQKKVRNSKAFRSHMLSSTLQPLQELQLLPKCKWGMGSKLLYITQRFPDLWNSHGEGHSELPWSALCCAESCAHSEGKGDLLSYSSFLPPVVKSCWDGKAMLEKTQQVWESREKVVPDASSVRSPPLHPLPTLPRTLSSLFSHPEHQGSLSLLHRPHPLAPASPGPGALEHGRDTENNLNL